MTFFFIYGKLGEIVVASKQGRKRDIAQFGRVPALGAGCRRFKSYYPDRKTILISQRMLSIYRKEFVRLFINLIIEQLFLKFK